MTIALATLAILCALACIVVYAACVASAQADKGLGNGKDDDAAAGTN